MCLCFQNSKNSDLPTAGDLRPAEETELRGADLLRAALGQGREPPPCRCVYTRLRETGRGGRVGVGVVAEREREREEAGREGEG